MNTSETPPDGVYFRNLPNGNDPSWACGLGVFMNEWGRADRMKDSSETQRYIHIQVLERSADIWLGLV